jgi:hypothetical protein
MKTFKIVLVLVSIAALSLALSSCDNIVTNNNTPMPPDNFTLNVWDYSESHYFVDTLYRRSFTEYYRDTITNYLVSNSIIESTQPLEVWVQCDAFTADKRFCVGKVMLGARPTQGYDTSVTNPELIVGDKFTGYFRKLLPSEFYHNNLAGFIGLYISIPGNYHVGVVYQNNSYQMFGKGYMESLPTDTIILKLVKIDFSDPIVSPLAWKLKMKNVYKLPYTNIIAFSSFNVKFLAGIVYRDTIPGLNIPLITMLKLDKFNNVTLLPPPDGKFDWLTGKTIFPEKGYFIFPILEPFAKGISDYGLDSNYVFGEIYSQSKAWCQLSPKAILYTIKGNAVY